MSRIRTVVATEILLLLGLAGFVGVCFVVEHMGDVRAATHFEPITAMMLGAFPALLWLGYFYLQDRHEPEPKHYVLGVFLLGAFFSQPVSQFLIEQAAPSPALGRGAFAPFALPRLLVAFLVVAMAQEFCKYAVVRYSVYQSREFDEPMDGIIYMTAAGIGFATHENYEYLMGAHGDVFLSTGAARVVVTTLAHACFAGILGFALGRAKFWAGGSLARTVILVIGLLSAASLNGAFSLARDIIAASGLTVTPWRAVAFAFGFAALMFFVLSILMQRLLASSPHKT